MSRWEFRTSLSAPRAANRTFFVPSSPCRCFRCRSNICETRAIAKRSFTLNGFGGCVKGVLFETKTFVCVSHVLWPYLHTLWLNVFDAHVLDAIAAFTLGKFRLPCFSTHIRRWFLFSFHFGYYVTLDQNRVCCFVSTPHRNFCSVIVRLITAASSTVGVNGLSGFRCLKFN